MYIHGMYIQEVKKVGVPNFETAVDYSGREREKRLYCKKSKRRRFSFSGEWKNWFSSNLNIVLLIETDVTSLGPLVDKIDIALRLLDTENQTLDIILLIKGDSNTHDVNLLVIIMGESSQEVFVEYMNQKEQRDLFLAKIMKINK